MYFLVILLVLFALILKSNHLLSVLITLEYLALMIFFFMGLMYLKNLMGFQMLIALMAAMGCESAVGLILFVVITRFYSKDYFLSSGVQAF